MAPKFSRPAARAFMKRRREGRRIEYRVNERSTLWTLLLLPYVLSAAAVVIALTSG